MSFHHSLLLTSGNSNPSFFLKKELKLLTALFKKDANSDVQNQTNGYVFHCHKCYSVSGNNEALRKIIKRSSFWVVIGGFRSILSVSVFKGQIFVAITRIDGSVKCNPLLDFELQSSRVIELHSE